MSSPFRATVVIASKNRKDELRLAIASCYRQSQVPEVIVIDDASTDGTGAMVASEFPQARLIVAQKSAGYIAQRNAGARLASTNIIFSIDDDAVFVHPSTIEDTLKDFECSDPTQAARIGAVAMPYIDTLISKDVEQVAPDRQIVYVMGSFRGTAHALRRDVFLALNGYREVLRHQGEEIDYCTRMLDAGYVVRVGNAPPLDHNESPKRDKSRIMFQNARNHILYAHQNVPAAAFPVRVAAMMFNLSRHGVKTKYVGPTTKGIIDGWKVSLSGAAPRAALTRQGYKAFRTVSRMGVMALFQLEPLLPPLRKV